MDVIVSTLGWIGAAVVLGGYLLFSAGKIPNGWLYQVLNFVGSGFVCVNVFAHRAWPSTIVNGIWAIIAAVVLARWAIERRRARGGSDEAPASIASPGLEAHPELPTTTLVLPVIGPAIRVAEATQPAEPAPSLQTGAVPMSESVPAITAAIAVALVSAAREQQLENASEATAH
jgi:hypothetical protein